MEAAKVQSAPIPSSSTNNIAAPASSVKGPNKTAAQSPRRRPRNGNKGADAPAQDQGLRKKVFVSGFPPFAQPQDLMYAFAKVGQALVERCSSNGAVLAFNTEAEAAAAIKASRRVFALGQLLVVQPCTEETQRTSFKRDFTRSKQKCVIIDPRKLSLSGDFHAQLDALLAAVRLTQEDAAALTALYSDLQAALQAQWPGCEAVPFGSITTGLGIKTSDADCFMDIPRAHRQYEPMHSHYVNKAKRLLQQYPSVFTEILSIPRANTPIVKFFHNPTRMNCDVSFKTPLGAQNSKLIAFLLHADPRLIPMAVAIKYWAKVHELSGTGKLTNYALTMMIIFYLQQPPMSILPSVEWLQRDEVNDYFVDGWNTGFNGQKSVLPPCSNTSSISELLGGFFEYYSMFNFEEMVICPFLGVPVKKEVFKNTVDMPVDFDLYKANVMNEHVFPLRYSTSFCVQDPFEQCHNVASSVSTKLASDIICFFKFAANAYEQEKLNKCQNFLKTILLEKPKIVRAKQHHEFRINLFPRIINTIIDPDWKPIVRELLMTVFEKMLKIKLGKVEEKVNPDTKKEKEKYSGTITRAIWKRKQFTKLYNTMDLGFQVKHERITEEILRADKQVIDLQFQLTVTYCHSPRSAAIVVRLGEGDPEAFREFGKFFISVLQNWFTVLLKPHARPNTNDTATKIAEAIDVLDDNVDIETDDEVSQDDDVNVTATSDVELTSTSDDPKSTDDADIKADENNIDDIVNLTNKCAIVNVSAAEGSARSESALVSPT